MAVERAKYGDQVGGGGSILRNEACQPAKYYGNLFERMRESP